MDFHRGILEKLEVLLTGSMGKGRKVFSFPTEVYLQKIGVEDAAVSPDLFVINGGILNTDKYLGVPDLIIEIVSPFTQSNDLVTKLGLYMEYGVREYWIVNPLINAVLLYSLDKDFKYIQADLAKDQGIIQSVIFPEFKIDIKVLFQ
jgi:Uma2 family endonuclease